MPKTLLIVLNGPGRMPPEPPAVPHLHMQCGMHKHPPCLSQPGESLQIPSLMYACTFVCFLCVCVESDHQAATKDQCERLMDFQGKMVEACQKFESLEEEHLAQMVTFMIKMAKVMQYAYVLGIIHHQSSCLL